MMSPPAFPCPTDPLARRGHRLPCLALLPLLPWLPASAQSALDLSRLPEPAPQTVSFATDILPLLENSCLRCHGPERPRSGFRIDHRDALLAGGNLGVAVVPGNSANSPLIHYVARLIPDLEMPPLNQGAPLSDAEIALLRAWIDQGAAWDDAPIAPTFRFTIEPTLQFIDVRGNAARFREHTGLDDGWGGGTSDFSLRYDLDPRTRLEMDGRAVAGREDYRFHARLTRQDLGWVRLGYREFHRYDDDVGGYYAPFNSPAPRLNADLQRRHQFVHAEVGLTLPNWPVLRLAYDLEGRQGSEATLHWGAVVQDDLQRHVFPGRKDVDETTHRLTLDIEEDWNGLRLANRTEFEWHDQDNLRTQYEFNTADFDYATRVRDGQDAWRAANVLRLERQLRDWLQLSGGYLYSYLRDLGGFSVEGFSPSDPALPPSLDLDADHITLRRQSHVANANALLTPWPLLHFYAGLQAEWTRQEGFATGQAYFQPTDFNANTDRTATDQNFGLRYSGLPSTVLYVESRFQQESYSQFEEGLYDNAPGFLRDTDTSGDLWELTPGFILSPWRQVSLHARYRHRHRSQDYEHPRDLDVLGSGNGYPAFFQQRRTATDELDLRLVLHPLRWLKSTLKYSLADTDFDSLSLPWSDPGTVPPLAYPASNGRVGQHAAHAVTAGFILTPWTRLNFAPSLTWSTSRTRSTADNGAELVPYDGDTWILLTTASFVVDQRTDLLATYLFNQADYSQNNAAAGLPLGVEYTRQALTFGVTRRLKRDRLVRLEYAWFQHDEPTLGGAADYTAHGFFASYRLSWP